jgi:hypothetical protein
MRYRPILAAAAAATVALSMHADASGLKKLDGKKTKTLTFALASSPQSNDTNLATDFTDEVKPTSASRPDMATCPESRCLSYSFVYKPAKHVKKGPFSVKIAWAIPGQDYDLYVLQDGGDVGHCGASAGTSETVVVPFPQPKKTYTVVVDQYRAAPDTVTGTVSFPATDEVGSSVPGDPDGTGLPVNCGL